VSDPQLRGPVAADAPTAPTARAAPAPEEVELKFEVTDAAAARGILEADELDGLSATGPALVVEIEDRYLETEDGRLRAAGWAARIRQGSTTPATLTLKTEARRSTGAVHRRSELEGPADPQRPPADWPASDARDLLIELLGDAPARELVTLRQRRRQRTYSDGETTVELSLDRIRAVADGRVVERSTALEAELHGGDEARLLAIGGLLESVPGLVPAGNSKLVAAVAAAERARRMAALPSLPIGKTPGVVAEDTLAEAGRKVIAFHFARMLAREPGTREGRDPEELHQMRVATRRMRAAWRVFADGFDAGATRRIRGSLRVLAGELGAVRDLDVLLDGMAAYRAALDPAQAKALEPLVAAWRADRDAGRRTLIRTLDSVGHRRWIARSITFLTTPGAGVVPPAAAAPHRIRETAPSRIWTAYELVRAYGAVLRWADVPTLHALRIEGKRLRYTLEFVRETLGPEANPLIERVTNLQDHLGLLNDADVAAARARSFLVERGAALGQAERDAIGQYLVHQEREVARLRRSIGRPWRGIDGIGFRRRLGRVVAQL
jgi:triphosphatase